MAEHRSESAPPPEDDAASSVPSSLYARCAATPSQALHARRLRQAVDADVKFLQNRLSKLRLEEQRAKQEVTALHNKAVDVEKSQQKHEETANMRRTLKDQTDYGKRREAALIALNKERQAKAVWAAKQRIVQDRREAVLAMRKQREINECRVHITKEEDRDKHLKQRETIRQLHVSSKLRREREAEAKREESRTAYAARMEQEQAEREAQEQLAAQLVAQEAQLIYRLKRMHQEKQSALENLATTVHKGNSQSRSRTHNESTAAEPAEPAERADDADADGTAAA